MKTAIGGTLVGHGLWGIYAHFPVAYTLLILLIGTILLYFGRFDT